MHYSFIRIFYLDNINLMEGKKGKGNGQRKKGREMAIEKGKSKRVKENRKENRKE